MMVPRQLCKMNAHYHKEFTGAFFDIVREMEPLEDAYCVWAGGNNDCSFDGLLTFLNESAVAGNDHRFIAGGMLFVLAYRISRTILPVLLLLKMNFCLSDFLRKGTPPFLTLPKQS